MSILFLLPLEVREEIYAFTISGIQIFWTHKDSSWPPRSPPMFPSFCFANRQMYTEIFPVLLREYEHVIESKSGFENYLRRALPNDKGFQYIRKLVLDDVLGLSAPSQSSRAAFVSFLVASLLYSASQSKSIVYLLDGLPPAVTPKSSHQKISLAI
jgi:hypothetical protein